MGIIQYQASGLLQTGNQDMESGVSDRHQVGLFVLEAGHQHQGLLPRQLPLSLGKVTTWVANELTELACVCMTDSVLVGMSVSSLLHQFSKLRSAPGAWWQGLRERDGSVTPMCSYCLATATDEWAMRHDKDCPWQREANRCKRCGYTTWWDEFVAEEQCSCHVEGMTPDV